MDRAFSPGSSSGHDTQAVGLGWYEDAPSVLENENVRHENGA
jgi:hypothetical protein